MAKKAKCVFEWSEPGVSVRCVRCSRIVNVRAAKAASQVHAVCRVLVSDVWLLTYFNRVKFQFTGRLNLARNVARAYLRFAVWLAHNRGRGWLVGRRYSERLEICESCDRRNGNRCGLCGCVLAGRLLSKARLESESCPLKNWPGDDLKGRPGGSDAITESTTERGSASTVARKSQFVAHGHQGESATSPAGPESAAPHQRKRCGSC